MGLQAKYDAREDRMLLTLQQGEGDARSFWVTRRQWLALLDAVTALGLPDDEPLGREAPAPVNRKRPLTPAAGKAVPVQALRLRPTASGGAKLAFVAGENGAAMSLPEAGLVRLRHLLQQQGERAEWDVAAALERHAARRIAGDVVSKARQG